MKTGRNDTRLPPLWVRTRIPARKLQFTLDLSALAGAFAFAYLLRFDFSVPPHEQSNALVQLPLVMLIQLLALSRAGVYSFIWRYIGLGELRAFTSAALMSAAPLVVLRMTLPQSLAELRVPISVIVINAFLAFGGVLGLRILRRLLYERYERKHSGRFHRERAKTILIGAGRGGVIVARELTSHDDAGMEVLGFVDDDREKLGAVIHGVKILGTTQDLPKIARNLHIEQVVITIASASRDDMDRIVRICESIPVKTRIIPGFDELFGGKLEISRIRDVQIEDLLARETVELDVDQLAGSISDRVVLVTGAGGSIGSELCRQAARFAPKKLLLVERAEPALYHIDIELRTAFPDLEIIPLVADVGDAPRMHSLLSRHRPDFLLHAAAHKHVPLMEQNPFEAIKNNVAATEALGRLAGELGVGVFVFISTDKAVRPTSMMGASKRVAELVVQDLDRHFDTRYVAVRFGNVLGSNGSVIPRFSEQIRNGGPVTVTHPDMKRYFMTIPEAAQLVLEAGAMGQGGEIFVLDMGEPVRIVDLAERMISLSGLRAHEDIDIEFTGIRPGEKLFEELDQDGESITKTHHPKIFIGRIAAYGSSEVKRALDTLNRLVEARDADGLRHFLAELLPESSLLEVTPVPAIELRPEAKKRAPRPILALGDVSLSG